MRQLIALRFPEKAMRCRDDREPRIRQPRSEGAIDGGSGCWSGAAARVALSRCPAPAFAAVAPLTVEHEARQRNTRIAHTNVVRTLRQLVLRGHSESTQFALSTGHSATLFLTPENALSKRSGPHAPCRQARDPARRARENTRPSGDAVGQRAVLCVDDRHPLK